MKYYKKRLLLNVLAGSKENAKEIYDAADKHVLIAVLSADYKTTREAINDMRKYNSLLEGNLSVGLGGGNPIQWRAVADIAKEIKANHFNQVFTGVGYTRANLDTKKSIVNVLVSPTGNPGYVNIATGPLSQKCEPLCATIDTVIKMAKDMGGSSIKFFPMDGLATKEELKAVAQACAANDFMLEPTGGINLLNFKEILSIILDAGVQKVIPHVYSSIMDKETGNTSIEDVKTLMHIVKELI